MSVAPASLLLVVASVRSGSGRQREAAHNAAQSSAGAHAAQVDRFAVLHGSRKASRRS